MLQCKRSHVMASNLAEQTPQPSADHSIETKPSANIVAHILQLLLRNPGFGWVTFHGTSWPQDA